MNPSLLQDLEAFLEAQGVVFDRLRHEDRSVAVRQWTSSFGNAFPDGVRFFRHGKQHKGYKEGVKAQYAFSQVNRGNFLLISITNELGIWRSSEHLHAWAYKCSAPEIPDLGQFCNLDFVVVASDFLWTMVYTHEDFVMGGPYFVRAANTA